MLHLPLGRFLSTGTARKADVLEDPETAPPKKSEQEKLGVLICLPLSPAPKHVQIKGSRKLKKERLSARRQDPTSRSQILS